MEDDIVNKIKIIMTQTGDLSESQVCHLMVLIRKLMERINIKESLVLRFFCDWAVHIEMNRTPTLEIIKKLNNLMANLKGCGNNNLIITLVSGVISFNELKKEITTLFKKARIPIGGLEDVYYWKRFVSLLTEILRDCPLRIPEEPTKKIDKQIIQEIKNNPLKQNHSIIQVSVKDGIPLIGQDRCLALLMSDTTTILIPLPLE